MTPSVHRGRSLPPRQRLVAWALSALVVAVVVAANARLVVVALASDPGCAAAPASAEGGALTFRAAKPSC